jgi:hypothetical protein
MHSPTSYGPRAPAASRRTSPHPRTHAPTRHACVLVQRYPYHLPKQTQSYSTVRGPARSQDPTSHSLAPATRWSGYSTHVVPRGVQSPAVNKTFRPGCCSNSHLRDHPPTPIRGIAVFRVGYDDHPSHLCRPYHGQAPNWPAVPTDRWI